MFGDGKACRQSTTAVVMLLYIQIGSRSEGFAHLWECYAIPDSTQKYVSPPFVHDPGLRPILSAMLKLHEATNAVLE